MNTYILGALIGFFPMFLLMIWGGLSRSKAFNRQERLYLASTSAVGMVAAWCWWFSTSAQQLEVYWIATMFAWLLMMIGLFRYFWAYGRKKWDELHQIRKGD